MLLITQQKPRKKFRLNTVILTKVKGVSINDIALSSRASNVLRSDFIRLVDVYLCDDAHDEILEKKSKGRVISR